MALRNSTCYYGGKILVFSHEVHELLFLGGYPVLDSPHFFYFYEVVCLGTYSSPSSVLPNVLNLLGYWEQGARLGLAKSTTIEKETFTSLGS
jgi:hypothetical protein